MATGEATAEHHGLEEQAARLWSVSLRELLAIDPDRARRDVQELAGLRLDWSRQHLDAEAWEALIAHAEQLDVPAALQRLFEGAPVNATEGRAALHTALRLPPGQALEVAGEDVAAQVQSVLARLEHFVAEVHSGRYRGHTGRAIRRVIHIGIGGSDLGPRMVCRALAPYAQATAEGAALEVRFVSNVDGTALTSELRAADPETTLFVIASKTFSTQETLVNARAARAWLLRHLPEAAVARHFVAVSVARERVQAFGIDPERMFGFWDWVGGRYSVWSAIGLPVALLLGMDGFRRFLAGAHAVDEHVQSTRPAHNAAVRMALVDYWNQNLEGACSRVVLPYDERLALLPAHLQQVEMESLGKRVCTDGNPVAESTGGIVWGSVGADGQHAFFQLLHQGTRVVPAEFIGVAHPEHDLPAQHPLLLANLVAQAQALAVGRDEAMVRREMAAAGERPERIDALAAHRVCPGNRPSTVILLERLNPQSLGALLALYEHKVYVLSILWGINAFDQWGVELGKQLAGDALKILKGSGVATDPATAATLDWLRARLPPEE